jgi:hypothetical protein
MGNCTQKFWIQQRDFWEQAIIAAQKALLEASESHIANYELDTSEGRQKIWEKKESSLNAAINNAVRQYEYWCRRIVGKGLIAMTYRRKPGR